MAASDPGNSVDIEREDRRRHRVNVFAAIGLGLFLLIVYGVVKMFVEHENMQNCVDSGRRNCVDLGDAPREGVRVLTR